MNKVMPAERAAEFICDGMTIVTSGFGGVGYPKVIPGALYEKHNARGLTVYSSAACGPLMDDYLARDGITAFRGSYQSVAAMRSSINSGEIKYCDSHLSRVPVAATEGLMGHIDIAIVECAAVTDKGLVLTSMVGACEAYVKMADRVIVELNETVPLGIAGIHDIYEPGIPPHVDPVTLTGVMDRIGSPFISCPEEKIAAIVISDKQDELSLRPSEEVYSVIGKNIVGFLKNEISLGRLPENLGPLQSGTGSVANCVLHELGDGSFSNLTIFTEVLQDSFIELLDKGIAVGASACSLSLSPDVRKHVYENIEEYKKKIILRPQFITNHPGIIQRLGVVSMNTPIECDIYGNVNSTHVTGSKIMNGIGGSGDFARNARISIFARASVAKGGAISSIVPMVSHVDHTEHDVDVIVTEYGVADLRMKSPVQRAELIISNCAHPDYRPVLQDYLDRARKLSPGQHTPHILTEAFSMHQKYLETGSMK